jgi:deoxyribodipyrimidine photo-lyase
MREMLSPPKPLRTAVLNFEPTLHAARARLAEVQPDAYARTRNALDGAVTRLSPYITHGLLNLRDVYSAVHVRQPLDIKHKFVFELGWRAYWRHVWHHLGASIHHSLHAGLLPDDAYQAEVPSDVLEARTGLPAIDQAVCELYATGYLHNHARMWLASYLVHMRKVHWHAGAQWMLGHLLDGDVASNHLSWQWVAGTGSSKPYLFNADNVAKYAPAHWQSPGTAIDVSYEELELCARSATAVNHPINGHRAHAATAQPALLDRPSGAAWSVPDCSIVAGRDVWLLHPWSLGTAPPGAGEGTLCVGVGFPECHAQTPWSERRWNFVTEGLKVSSPVLWWGSAQQVADALRDARSVGWQSNPHAVAGLDTLQTLITEKSVHPLVATHLQPCLFEPVQAYCQSFSQWWRKTRIAL